MFVLLLEADGKEESDGIWQSSSIKCRIYWI